jgi:hypothetical protein
MLDMQIEKCSELVTPAPGDIGIKRALSRIGLLYSLPFPDESG